MQRAIVAFQIDEEAHWVAVLDCGHSQHVRHNPPMVSRPWVLTEEGRRRHVGILLNCVLCDRVERSEAEDVSMMNAVGHERQP